MDDIFDQHSWIKILFYTFKDFIEPETNDEEDISEQEGLEPPMLDETWGLKNTSHHTKSEQFSSFSKIIQGTVLLV